MSILLTAAGRPPDRRQRYVLATFLTTLGIPFRQDGSDGLLLWPDEAVEPAPEIAIDSASLARAFDLLSRREEIETGERDDLGRFPLASSTLADDFRCHVDDILEQFNATIREAVGQCGIRWRPASAWPDGAPFAVCLTHDVDWTTKWHWRTLLGQLGQGAWRAVRGPKRVAAMRGVARDLRSAWRRENPYWNFAEIAGRERQYGFRSTFFVIADGQSRHDGDYSLQDPRIINLLEQLQSVDAEIALHGSYLSFERPELLQQELQRLTELVGEVSGCRQHYLRFDVQRTLAAYEALGLHYDSSLGFAEHEGYRSGFSFPYAPYDFGSDRPFRVLEIPLTIMDATLYRYRRLPAHEAWLAVERQLEVVRQSGGCCTLLWHNNYFDDASYPGYGDVYWRALDWIAANNGWATSADEIWRWWHRRTAETDLSQGGEHSLQGSANRQAR